MGTFRYVGMFAEVQLRIGNPRPALVQRDMVFTVDDDADEAYSNAPEVYQAVAAPAPVTPPAAPSTSKEA